MADANQTGLRARLQARTGKQIRELREAAGLSQAALAEMVGTSQQTIDRIERGETQRSSFIPDIFAALGVPREGRMPTTDELQRDLSSFDVLKKPAPLLHPFFIEISPDEMPVFVLAEDERHLFVSPEPIQAMLRPPPLMKVRGAYALKLATDVMAPVYRRGEVALVHPFLEPRLGDDVIFRETADSFLVDIGTLLEEPRDGRDWHFLQWGQPAGDQEQFATRRDSPIGHVIFGKYRHLS